MHKTPMARKTAVLFINIGSPTALTTSSIRRYLREFLGDYRVINLPRFMVWLLLNFYVLPFRPRKSLLAYQKIWQENGSPLLFLSKQLVTKVATQFDPASYSIDCAMRYGQPSIAKQIKQYKKNAIKELIIIPLYPQYSSTTTASVYDEIARLIMQWRHIPTTHFVSDYHQNPLYIDAIAQSVVQSWTTKGKNKLLLMSFHGLPACLTQWGDPYFAQCQQTAQLVAKKLALSTTQWKIVFQSRFGKAKWLQPYCIEVLQALPKQGIKKIDIICPGFAVDCLETLEEIKIRNKAVFMDAGGEIYEYIPALNATKPHVNIMVELIKTSKQDVC